MWCLELDSASGTADLEQLHPTAISAVWNLLWQPMFDPRAVYSCDSILAYVFILSTV